MTVTDPVADLNERHSRQPVRQKQAEINLFLHIVRTIINGCYGARAVLRFVSLAARINGIALEGQDICVFIEPQTLSQCGSRPFPFADAPEVSAQP
jgi:hypothetical protein